MFLSITVTSVRDTPLHARLTLQYLHAFMHVNKQRKSEEERKRERMLDWSSSTHLHVICLNLSLLYTYIFRTLLETQCTHGAHPSTALFQSNSFIVQTVRTGSVHRGRRGHTHTDTDTQIEIWENAVSKLSLEVHYGWHCVHKAHVSRHTNCFTSIPSATCSPLIDKKFFIPKDNRHSGTDPQSFGRSQNSVRHWGCWRVNRPDGRQVPGSHKQRWCVPRTRLNQTFLCVLKFVCLAVWSRPSIYLSVRPFVFLDPQIPE